MSVTVSLRQQYEELQRTLSERDAECSRLMRTGKLSEREAKYRLDRLRGAVENFGWILDHERVIRQRVIGQPITEDTCASG